MTLPRSLVPGPRPRARSVVSHESLTRNVLAEIEIGGEVYASTVDEIQRHRAHFHRIPQ